MNVSDSATQNLALTSWVWLPKHQDASNATAPTSFLPAFDLLRPLRKWLDEVEVRDAELAKSLCKMIPAQCPFERDVKILGRTLFHIPPMCKLNPLYEQVVGLRFRALCYLADECGEDVTCYC